jgi:hypothetical protein
MGLLSKAASRGIGQKKAELLQFQRTHEVFCGIIFEAPDPNEYRGFIEQIATITAFFALTLSLPVYRCIILFPASIDKELVAHRISKMLNTKVRFIFESESPEQAFESFRSFL